MLHVCFGILASMTPFTDVATHEHGPVGTAHVIMLFHDGSIPD